MTFQHPIDAQINASRRDPASANSNVPSKPWSQVAAEHEARYAIFQRAYMAVINAGGSKTLATTMGDNAVKEIFG